MRHLARVTPRRLVVAALFALGTASAVLGTGGCHGSSNPSGLITAAQITTWTVMAYGAGRNESAAATLGAISQIKAANLSSNLVYEAALSNVDLFNPPFLSTQRGQVVKGKTTVFRDLGLTNMADPAELTGFVVDAANAAPAQFYCLILEGHGGLPFRGIGSDLAAVTTLDLAKLDSALTNARQQSGIPRFDVIGLDSAESVTVETLAVLQKHASFVVGFGGAALASGFDYAALANALSQNPGIKPAALAAAIANGIATRVAATSQPDASQVTNATFDLAKAGAILTALDKLGSALTADVSSGTTNSSLAAIAAIGSCRSHVVEFDPRAATNLVDLADLSQKIASVKIGPATGFLSSASIAAATTLSAAINAAFTPGSIGAVGSAYLPGEGLGVYFPHAGAQLAANYTAVASAFAALAPNWVTFLNTYYGAVAGTATKPAVTINVPSTIVQNSIFTCSGTVTPASLVHDVTLLITTPIQGQNVLIKAVPLGTPDPVTGAIAFTGSMTFTSINDGTNTVTVATLRQVRGPASAFAIDADVQYSTSGGSPTVIPGFLKVESVAGVSSGGIGLTAWTPLGPNGAIGRDEILGKQASVTQTLFPRTVFVDPATGALSSLSQSKPAAGLNPASPSGLRVDTTGVFGTPPAVTVWLVVESTNGDLGFASKPVTLQ